MRWACLVVMGCSVAQVASGLPDTPEPPAVTTTGRVVGIGDLHGDLDAARTVLRNVGAIDTDDHWMGGDLVVVQTGDVLDRGDDEKEILDLFETLAREAHAAGGAFVALLGNHELMNVRGDFRYVTSGAASDWPDRAAAFVPGGPEASRFASRDLIIVVNDTVFVHGGVLPSHARYGVAKINAEVKAWLNGDAASLPEILTGADSPQWSRHYSDEPDSEDCRLLEESLRLLGAKRMVVGHTVQRRPNSACDGRVWRVDVGMSAHYGGSWGAVSIEDDVVAPMGPR